MCLYKSSVDGVDLMEALFDRMFALPMIIQLFVIEPYAVDGLVFTGWAQRSYLWP